MARQSEFYRGRNKKKNLAIIPTIIVFLIVGIILVLFYSTQNYAVITDDGVKIELPLLSSGADSQNTADDESTVFEEVDIAVQFEEPDYSGVSADIQKRIPALRAIYVPYDDVTPEKINEYANRLSTGNSLVLNLKQSNGYMAWYSDSPVAYSYGLNMNNVDSKETLKMLVSGLKDSKIYLIAEISCLRDELLGAHSTEVCLRNQYGTYYFDDYGYWLDPYSSIVRNYTVQLVEELWDIGFDEVVLTDLRHPVAEDIENPDGTTTPQIVYNREMSTEPTPLAAISGFAVNIAERLSDRDDGKYLSAYVYSTDTLAGKDKKNGQDMDLFMKLFDRVYYNTDKYAYTFNLQDVTPHCTVGNVKNRFVPVVINYLPENTSWILVDQG